MSDRARSFETVAAEYERWRPDYPAEALRWAASELCLTRGARVLDVGAGTGKLTRALVALGHRVWAVEPLPEMLEQLVTAAPGAFDLLGSAEVIPMPDASADVVTAAQAFHWFDHAVALPEIARVLRPQGRLALVWNTRDDREPWVADLSRTLGVERVTRGDAEEPIAASGLFGPVEKATFEWAQRLDAPTLRDLALSRSYVAIKSREEQERLLADVDRLFAEHAKEGTLELPYIVECYRASRLSSS